MKMALTAQIPCAIPAVAILLVIFEIIIIPAQSTDNTQSSCSRYKSLAKSCGTPPSPATEKKNVVFLLLDDMVCFDDIFGKCPANPKQIKNPKRGIPKAFAKKYLPNMHAIANSENSLRLINTYGASMCAVARYNIFTGQYCATGSNHAAHYSENTDRTDVTVPNCRLQSVLKDSSAKISSKNFAGYEESGVKSENIATLFNNVGKFRTGYVGKWHLSSEKESNLDQNGPLWNAKYTTHQTLVKKAGFDYADGIYISNVASGGGNGFSHNLEWSTEKVVEFLDGKDDNGSDSAKTSSPFFLYYGLHVPHSPKLNGDAFQFTVRDTPAGKLNSDPKFPNANYMGSRASILSRAKAACTDTDITNSENSGWCSETSGKDSITTEDIAALHIYADYAVGSVIKHLESKKLLDETIIILASDHGMFGKGGLYEGGVVSPLVIKFPTNNTTTNTSTDKDTSQKPITAAFPAHQVDFASNLLHLAGVDACLPQSEGIPWFCGEYPQNIETIRTGISSATSDVAFNPDFSSKTGRWMLLEDSTDRGVVFIQTNPDGSEKTKVKLMVIESTVANSVSNQYINAGDSIQCYDLMEDAVQGTNLWREKLVNQKSDKTDIESICRDGLGLIACVDRGRDLIGKKSASGSSSLTMPDGIDCKALFEKAGWSGLYDDDCCNSSGYWFSIGVMHWMITFLSFSIVYFA